MIEVIVDAIVDSLKILPLLFVVYIFIEFLELKASQKLNFSHTMKGGWAPLIATLVGIIPQCGFSVVSADLYSKKKINVATLMSVFVATSDEAIPIIISNPTHIINLLWLILAKLALALIIGYSTWAIMHIVGDRKIKLTSIKTQQAYIQMKAKVYEAPREVEKVDLINFDVDGDSVHMGCCGHEIENKNNQALNLIHPIVHCLKVFVYILIVNLIMGTVIYYVGEESLIVFLNKSIVFQPILAVLVGLIPNCASSVVLTELFLLGGLSFGSTVAGLCINAGIGFAVLFRNNRNMKTNFLILITLLVFSCVIGMLLNLIF